MIYYNVKILMVSNSSTSIIAKYNLSLDNRNIQWNEYKLLCERLLNIKSDMISQISNTCKIIYTNIYSNICAIFIGNPILESIGYFPYQVQEYDVALIHEDNIILYDKHKSKYRLNWSPELPCELDILKNEIKKFVGGSYNERSYKDILEIESEHIYESDRDYETTRYNIEDIAKINMNKLDYILYH